MRKTLIFDLDGTLLNTLGDLHKSTNYAMKSLEFPERSLSEVREFVGNGIRKLIERACPEQTPRDTIEEATVRMKAYYAEHIHDLTVPYPGILPLLEELKQEGYEFAIVSNKADPLIQRLCAYFFHGLISVAVGETPDIPRKPQPDMVYAALKRLGKTASDAIYIGDSEVDLITAKNCGLPAISVGWGFRDPSFLREAGAKNLAMTAEELRQMIHEA